MNGSEWNDDGWGGGKVEGQGGTADDQEDHKKFLGTQWAAGESVVQIMVDEYRDTQIDSGEGVALAGC